MGNAVRRDEAWLAAHLQRAAPAERHPHLADSGKQALYALGRLKAGAMNRTEAAYARHLEQRQHAGEVAWFKFEGMKLRLADNTLYTPDFAVMLADGCLEMHEVKGARGIYQDDAKVKVKVASTMFPLRFKVVFPRTKKDGGGWAIESFD